MWTDVSCRHRNQSGQIGVIIILIMVVLLTVGLSLASRSTREVRLAQQEEESTRVFNAAEAGVEKALSTDLSAGGDLVRPGATQIPGTNATVDYAIQKIRVLETRLFEGVSARVQLRDTGGTPPSSVNIDWAKETNCSGAASEKPATLLVSIFSVDTASPPVTKVRYETYAACDRGDGISVAGAGSDGYTRRATITLQPSDAFLRIKPVYNDTSLKVTPSAGTLPVQYYNIRSSATNDLGTENRIVEVNRTLPVAPSIMDYALFSGSTLVK